MPTTVMLGGRYRLVEPAGQGGAARVWRAVDETLGRPVAVKVVDVQGSPDPAAAARFERELRATARLAHPNVVTVFDGGFEGDRAFLVMELLAGPSLAELVATRGPLVDALGYAEQVCAGLGAAHDAGIVHRDLKPANLVLSEKGVVKIVDFGIARLLTVPTAATELHLTATQTVLGTAAYVAPEQASGGWVDGRADLYALGCVLFFLLTGAPPYDADNPLAVLGQHIHAPVPSVRERRPDVPVALDGLVRDLLAKDPGRRPQRAGDALARIRALRPPAGEAQPQTAPLPTPAPAVTVPSRPSRRRRRLVAAAVLLAVLVTAVSLALATGRRGTRPPRPAQSAQTTVPPTTSPTTTATTATTAPPTTQGPLTADQAAAQLGTAVQQTSASGDLTASAVADLTTRVEALQRDIAAGKPGQVGHAVGDLAQHLDDLVNSGQLTSAGRAAFDPALSALAQLYPNAHVGTGGKQPGD